MKSIIRAENDIHNRLEKLERQNIVLKYSFILLLLPLFFVLFIGASNNTNSYTANQFTLVDKNGKTRGVWEVNDNNVVNMKFYDENKNENINMSIQNNGCPSLMFFDKSNIPRICLGLDKKNYPIVSLFDENGNNKISIKEGDVFTGYYVFNKSETDGAIAGLGTDGNSVGLYISNTNKDNIGFLGFNPEFNIKYVITDKNGKLIHESPNNSESQQRQDATPQIKPGKIAWRKLRKGMSKSDVLKLLGEPTHVNAREFGDIWTYPSSGRVTFHSKALLLPGNVADTVSGWKEPSN